MTASIVDPTLIEVDQVPGVGTFIGAMLAAVVSLTFAWGAVMEDFIHFKRPFDYTSTEYCIGILVKAVRTRNADIAILGSSLASRIEPEFFTDATVMNMACGGGSVMTGLEVLNAATSLPKHILVEINILDRPIDEEQVMKAKAGAKLKPWAVLAGVTKPLRFMLAAPLFSYGSPEEQSAWLNSRRISLLAKKAATYDIQSSVSVGVIEWNQRNSWDIADKNFKRIEQLIPDLEARGASVHLLYLPYTEAYDNHPFTKRNRIIASGNNAFACQRCIDVRQLVNVDELRWADGAHLDERSAAIVSEALQSHLFPERRQAAKR